MENLGIALYRVSKRLESKRIIHKKQKTMNTDVVIQEFMKLSEEQKKEALDFIKSLQNPIPPTKKTLEEELEMLKKSAGTIDVPFNLTNEDLRRENLYDDDGR